jgi:nucleotide-binding universal stress UspA family protein
MEKIMIAIDYSPAAKKVAEAGFKIAKALHAKIIIAHAITQPDLYGMPYSTIIIMGYESGFSADIKANIEHIKTEAQNYLDATVLHLGDKTIQTAVLEGDADEAILKYSKKQKVDLIIMGSQRHKGIDGLMLPDVAVKVLKHSKIPLLTIPTNE